VAAPGGLRVATDDRVDRPTPVRRDDAAIVPNVERIAVLRANALGDLVVALPALEALRAAYPAAEITLLGREHHVAILGSRPGPVDRVIALPEGAVGDEARRDPDLDRDGLLDDLAARDFDLAIQLHGGGRNSNRFVRRLGARTTAGSRTVDAPELDRWLPYVPFQWEIARYLDIVRLVGAEPVTVEPRLVATDDDRAALAAELPVLRSGPWAVVHPGATDPRRRWPVESFRRVARELVDRGRRVVVTGTRGEEPLVEPIAAALGTCGIAATSLSLPALLGLLDGADVVVANDTGPLHLATALGVPTVGIFWVGNLLNAGPFSRLRDRPLVSWRMTCPVCGADASAGRCEHDPSYVADVPVEAAIDQAIGLLDGR
jgi:ADP-heptose:LPS heptosyltransferase